MYSVTRINLKHGLLLMLCAQAMDKLHQQQAAAEAVDADAEDEGTVNQEVAELVVQRLEDGRRYAAS